MDWWKRKKSQADEEKPRIYEEQQRLIRSREVGAMLLEDLIECCDGKSNPITFFSADQIIKAINKLCKCRVPQKNQDLCKCIFVSELSVFRYSMYGHWYSGTLDYHRMILLVEKSWRKQYSDTEGFYRLEVRDIAISSMVSGHKNFMKLAGCCLETEFPLMVYYGEKKQYSRLDLKVVLSWRKRMKIAEEIATALAYLHTAFSRPFVYCSMDLRNILLDENGVAKLWNFANCVSIPQGETFVKLGRIWRGFDYMDDDYLINSIVSEKTDAFGFGILMQKLLTGEEIFQQRFDRNSRWLSKSIGDGRIDEMVVHPPMLHKMGQVLEEDRSRMEAFAILSERCIGLRGEVPKMVKVAKEIKKILQTISSSPSGETQIGSSSVILPNQV